MGRSPARSGSESRRLLGIDYGIRRIGLSYGDALGVAVPLPPATAPSEEKRVLHISDLIAARRITDIVVGLPCRGDGSATDMTADVEAFVTLLEQRCKVPIHRIDEYLTTHQARLDIQKVQGKQRKSLRAQRLERRSGLLDSRAATLILQDYLDRPISLSKPKRS